jgi:GT2 family glycosyltransferase
MKLSAIILTMTTTEELFRMTSNCISSLIASENATEMEVVIVESNKNYLNVGFKYPDFVTVIVPESDFNFHKFLNIGIKASTGEYVALCNNDLVFQNNWFTEILKVKEENPSIKSFSPNGKIDDCFFRNKFEIGYKVQTHVKGWCIVANREVFPSIGFLDETFDFYYADNDYAMSLKCNNIKHALVFNSYVTHLEKKSSTAIEKHLKQKKDFIAKYKIPNYLSTGDYGWILEDEKSLSGFLKFYSKWGPPNLVYRKNKIADILIKYKLGYFVKFLFKTKQDSVIFMSQIL